MSGIALHCRALCVSEPNIANRIKLKDTSNYSRFLEKPQFIRCNRHQVREALNLFRVDSVFFSNLTERCTGAVSLLSECHCSRESATIMYRVKYLLKRSNTHLGLSTPV